MKTLHCITDRQDLKLFQTTECTALLLFWRKQPKLLKNKQTNKKPHTAAMQTFTLSSLALLRFRSEHWGIETKEQKNHMVSEQSTYKISTSTSVYRFEFSKFSLFVCFSSATHLKDEEEINTGIMCNVMSMYNMNSYWLECRLEISKFFSWVRASNTHPNHRTHFAHASRYYLLQCD